MIETELIQGSLFTGIGGFDLGFKMEGIKTTWQAEQDKNCLQLLENKFPEARRYTDVREIERDTETVDIITGGFPCQDVSVAGRRAGLAGERSGLWFEFHRIIAEHLPRWVVIENVPGLLSSNEGRDFAVILRGLVECGYGVAWRVLDAQYFGVAQRRRRVFIVGSLGNGRAAKVLFESEGVPGDTAPSREAGQGFAKVAGTLSATSGDGKTQQGNELDFCIPTTYSLTLANTNRNRNGPYHNTEIAQTLDSWGQAVNTVGALQARDSKGIGTTIDDKIIWSADKSPTLGKESNSPKKSSSGQMVDFSIVQNGVRRLTPTECERLQGFPDGWTEGFPDSVRYRMLGNAVAVPVIRWLAKRIKEQRCNR